MNSLKRKSIQNKIQKKERAKRVRKSQRDTGRRLRGRGCKGAAKVEHVHNFGASRSVRLVGACCCPTRVDEGGCLERKIMSENELNNDRLGTRILRGIIV
jgi:hypothetical protein